MRMTAAAVLVTRAVVTRVVALTAAASATTAKAAQLAVLAREMAQMAVSPVVLHRSKAMPVAMVANPQTCSMTCTKPAAPSQ